MAADGQSMPNSLAPVKAAPYVPRYFIPAELALVEAMAERIFPENADGPGAKQLGVGPFIDGQLFSPWGFAARWYMKGPFVSGPPQLGYQLPWTPRQLYRLACGALDRHCLAQEGVVFARLPPERQDAVITLLEAGALMLDGVPGKVFFELVRGNTLEGAFADPLYGGNRHMAGWKMCGFPGARADFMLWVNQNGAPYPFGPVAIPPYQHVHGLHEGTMVIDMPVLTSDLEEYDADNPGNTP
ncbi:gluconate 2-dehydrogenase subunit 3 family protein [Formicincola oecophyllae]|uniref:Gluconate 2-dehydrogenase subunit 3 family protein n=2 Tax=Formicincola oecophyllae TaxID=2558361 RepID=A0A4Y6UB33_9PROT|nr:gluconate 2-dehydrogenase subunit 3 family protein [Formicincola oecophyllae]